MLWNYARIALQNMKILAIESSCDESSIAILERIAPFEYSILSHETISQINLHTQYGGVYPALARREHELNLVPILEKCLLDSKLITAKVSDSNSDLFINEKLELILERHAILKEKLKDFLNKINTDDLKNELDYIAVTVGPGLPPALWVGVNFAKTLATILDKPLYTINHMQGHIIAAAAERHDNKIILKEFSYPALSLLISGGHTEMILSKDKNSYEKIGETVDDAVGECYDKVARMLGLPYPGGPEISKLAKIGRQKELDSKTNLFKDTFGKNLPRPMIHSHDLIFSFSGLKTAVLYLIRDYKLQKNISPEENLSEDIKVMIATEFEEVVKDIFVKKLAAAIFLHNVQTVIVGGGVASNDYLRENFKIVCDKNSVECKMSSKELSTDNALMIGLTAMSMFENNILPIDRTYLELENLIIDSGLSF